MAHNEGVLKSVFRLSRLARLTDGP